MSSSEGEERGSGPLTATQKKRRRANACDMCRKRKIKCDGRQPLTGRCTNCNSHDWDCIYNSTISMRYDSGYLKALEVKVKKLESLIKRLLPDQDFTQEVGFELTRDNWMIPGVCGTSTSIDIQSYTPSSSNTEVMPALSVQKPSSLGVLGPDQAPPITPPPEDDHSEDEVNNHTTKLQNLPAIDVAKPRDSTKYLGKSSRAGLLKTVLALCSKLNLNVDTEAASRVSRNRSSWQDSLMCDGSPEPFQFPEHDLMDELIKIFFYNVHMFAPILHRPTFEADVKSGSHLRSREFGSVVLLVCALAARFSYDRRVLVPGEDNWYSAGWRYFEQVRLYNNALNTTPSSHLHRLQTICLGVMYGITFSSVYASLHAALGIRLALDIGAHKRRAYGIAPSVEDELYKRVFWTLVFFDRTLNGSMGHPSSIQEEDFDIELPLCCDDEYIDPERGGKQPEGIPSRASYFVWMLKLSQIQGLAMRTIYASTKARAHYKFQGEDWTTRTIAQLDSLLNNWANSVPEHLRWDPTRINDFFFCQSAHLWMQYHEMRIMVHRQFISSLQATPIPFTALAICTSAARSLVHLTSSLYTRLPNCTGILHWGAGYAGLVLLIGIGNSRLHNLVYDRKSAMDDIETMLSIFRLLENRWRWATRYTHMLQVLKVIGEDDNNEPVERRKRRFEEDPDAPQVANLNLNHASSTEDRIRDVSGSANWDEPSMFGSNPTDHSRHDASHPPAASHAEDPGVMFGNIDFGALFGFGTADETLGHGPSSHLSGDVYTFSSFAASDQHVGASHVGDWSGNTPYDLGMDDSQWMLPEQATYVGYPTFPGGQNHG